MEILASLLRASRALLDKKQEEVGAWVKLDQQEISRWEAGKYKLLSIDAMNLQKTFEENGLEFVPPGGEWGAWVRWRKPGRVDPNRAAQFRAARAMANLTLRELGAVSGVSRTFIYRLERGKPTAFNFDALKGLEATFNRFEIELTPATASFGSGVRWTAAEPTVLKKWFAAKT
ncbi:helix-turn-helix transcriptional regulator [Rhizobium ruizarguesonis]|nr:helix-turn-helix transcriptional regulator [Rhizobium ruizarguesonis]